jgi:hypothetical protein
MLRCPACGAKLAIARVAKTALKCNGHLPPQQLVL